MRGKHILKSIRNAVHYLSNKLLATPRTDNLLHWISTAKDEVSPDRTVSHLVIIAARKISLDVLVKAIYLSKPPGWSINININGIHSEAEKENLFVLLTRINELLSPRIRISLFSNSAWGRHEMLHSNISSTVTSALHCEYSFYHIICEKTVPLYHWQSTNKILLLPKDNIDTAYARLKHKQESNLTYCQLGAQLEDTFFRDLSPISFQEFTLKPNFSATFAPFYLNLSSDPWEYKSYNPEYPETDVVPPFEVAMRTDFVNVWNRLSSTLDENGTLYRLPKHRSNTSYPPVLDLWRVHQHSPFGSCTALFANIAYTDNNLQLLARYLDGIFGPEMKFWSLVTDYHKAANLEGEWTTKIYTPFAKEHIEPSRTPATSIVMSEEDLSYTENIAISDHPSLTGVVWGRKCNDLDLQTKFLKRFAAGCYDKAITDDHLLSISDAFSCYQELGSCNQSQAAEVRRQINSHLYSKYIKNANNVFIRSFDGKTLLEGRIIDSYLFISGKAAYCISDSEGSLSITPVSEPRLMNPRLVDASTTIHLSVCSSTQSIVLIPSVRIGPGGDFGIDEPVLIEVEFKYSQRPATNNEQKLVSTQYSSELLLYCPVTLKVFQRLAAEDWNSSWVFSPEVAITILDCPFYVFAGLKDHMFLVIPANCRESHSCYALSARDIRSVDIITLQCVSNSSLEP